MEISPQRIFVSERLPHLGHSISVLFLELLFVFLSGFSMSLLVPIFKISKILIIIYTSIF